MPHYNVHRGASGAAAVKVRLRKGETIKAESDALVVKSKWIEIGSNMEGGILGGVARAFFTGESFFFQTLTATHGEDNEVMLAAQELGDITLVHLRTSSDSLLLQRGAFLAADQEVSITSTTQRSVMKCAFSGSGTFILEAIGTGTLAFSSYGGIVPYRLDTGETISVDNGHLVAWSSGMQWDVGMASKSIYSSVASGEGMMCHFTGPGVVYVQTHKQQHDPNRPDSHKMAKGGTQGGPFTTCISIIVFILFACLALAIYD